MWKTKPRTLQLWVVTLETTELHASGSLYHRLRHTGDEGVDLLAVAGPVLLAHQGHRAVLAVSDKHAETVKLPKCVCVCLPLSLCTCVRVFSTQTHRTAQLPPNKMNIFGSKTNTQSRGVCYEGHFE